jgi:hypothetical protein
MSFAIANNLLTPIIRATNLKITLQTTTIAWNNFENLKDRFPGMKHLEKYSYTILESPLKNKWGIVVEA